MRSRRQGRSAKGMIEGKTPLVLDDEVRQGVGDMSSMGSLGLDGFKDALLVEMDSSGQGPMDKAAETGLWSMVPTSGERV